MAVHGSPDLLRRQLGRRLRDVREARGETATEVAMALEISPSQLSRIETGRRAPGVMYVRELCRHYGLDEPTTSRLVEMARDSRRSGWWESYDLPAVTSGYISWESAAIVIENFEVSLIPGLLQTRAYALAMLRSVHPEYPDKRVQEIVETRMTRKQVLTGDGLTKFHAVIDEVAFERSVGGPAAMREQLASLIDSAQNPRVTIQIVPESVGAYRGIDGGFSILGFVDDGKPQEVVYAEGALGMLYQANEDDINQAHEVFRGLTELAASPQDSIGIIQRNIAKYTDQQESRSGPNGN